ncbi:hypothetical protein [Photobacterium damselae]|uniref:hypothetical protein n=1 Tax=Photobacterium damselae TaxID=38293 RepID=UPI004068FA6A
MKESDRLISNFRKCDVWLSALNCVLFISMFTWCVSSLLFLKVISDDWKELVVGAPLLFYPVIINYKLFGAIASNRCSYSSSAVYFRKFFEVLIFQCIGLVYMHCMDYNDAVIPMLLATLFLAICLWRFRAYVCKALEEMCTSGYLRNVLTIELLENTQIFSGVEHFGQKVAGCVLVLEEFDKGGVVDAFDQFVFNWCVSAGNSHYGEHSPVQSMLEILCLVRDKCGSQNNATEY